MFAKTSSSFSSWYQLDSILETLLPRFYEAETRVIDVRHEQHQDMDECKEDMYESALADSEFAQWLNCPLSQSQSTAQNENALERLRMLVVHLGSSFVSRPALASSSQKGKGKRSSSAEHWRNA